MQNKHKSLSAYAGARIELYLVAVFTTINLGMIFADSDTVYLFSAFLPYTGALFAKAGGVFFLSPVLCAVLLTAVPIAGYYLCAALCTKHIGWMWAGAALYLIDSIYLAWFVTGPMDGDLSGFVGLILIHAVVLAALIWGAIAGGRMKRAGIDPKNARPDRIMAAFGEGAKLQFPYDADLARQNGAEKTGAYIAVTIVFTVLTLALCFGGALFLAEVDAAVFLWAWLALIVLLVVGFIAIAANMAKRVGLRRTCVFVEEDGTICFARYNAVYRLAAPKLAGAYRDVIDITYEKPNGKRKKFSIPNAYAGLEAWAEQNLTRE